MKKRENIHQQFISALTIECRGELVQMELKSTDADADVDAKKWKEKKRKTRICSVWCEAIWIALQNYYYCCITNSVPLLMLNSRCKTAEYIHSKKREWKNILLIVFPFFSRIIMVFKERGLVQIYPLIPLAVFAGNSSLSLSAPWLDGNCIVILLFFSSH